jgi:uncharacterized protein (DUF849 family)
MRKPTPEFEPAAFTNEELRNLLKWILRATTDTLHLMEKHDEQLGDVVDDSYVDEEVNRQVCEPVTISATQRQAYRDQVINPKWMAKDQYEDRSTLTRMIKLLRKREDMEIAKEGDFKFVLRDIDFFTFYETVASYLAKVQDGKFEPEYAAMKIAESAKEYQTEAQPMLADRIYSMLDKAYSTHQTVSCIF